MKPYLLTVICFLLCHQTKAQNLVVNGSFEQYTSCPTMQDQLTLATGWSGASTEYFNSCNTGLYSVPSNLFGYQAAAQGNAYAGFSPPGERCSGTMAPMQIGKEYEISMSISLADYASEGMANPGILLSKNPINYSLFSLYSSDVQVSFANYGVILNTTGWSRLVKTIIADSAYAYLAIAFFRPHVFIPNTSPGAGNIASPYYYVDSVVVKRIYGIDINFQDTTLCAADTIIVPFTVNKPNFTSNNVFTVQLSDDSGNFANAINIGNINAAISGNIQAVIPVNIPYGIGYKLRILASNQADTSSVTLHNIRIDTLPAKPNATNNSPLCEGAALNLTAISSTMGISYSWEGPGGYTSNSAAPVRTNAVTTWSGDYISSVTLLNGCSTKDTTTVIVHPIPDTPKVSSNSPVCAAGEIQLTSSTVTGASYEWSGPGLYNSTQQNAKRQNVQLTDAGTYTVIAKVHNCPSAPASTNVVVNKGPEVLTYPNPGDTLCPGWDVSFVAVPKNTGGIPSYEWYKNGAAAGGTATSYKATGVSDGDSFYVLMTAGSACNTPISSKPIRITVLPVHTPPTINISSNLGAHVWPYVEVKFKASTGNSGAHPGYQWTRNGNDISKANDSTWSATDLKTGDTICCIVTSNFLCAIPREVMSNCIVMNVDLGVDETQNVRGMRLYPNPNDGSFTLETSEPGILYISNLQGQTMGEYKVQKGKNSIVLPKGIADGIYMGRFGDSAIRINVVR